MDVRQIQTMRALLAAQTPPNDAGAPKLARKLSDILLTRPAPWTPVLLLGDGEAFAEPSAPIEAALLPQSPAIAESQTPFSPDDPIPPEILLGDLSPRRSAFGQRSEVVLDLREPAPPEARRLILLAADGEAVGEIVLHADDMMLRQARPQRALELQHYETPFFPEDLADELPLRQRHVFGKAPPKRAPSPPAPPTRELAAVFLLADLAARLASEEAMLRHLLMTVQASAKAA